MYKMILVPIDVTEDVLTSNGLKHAVYLAKMSQAKLMLFHSVPDISKFSISYNYHYELLSSFADKAVQRSKEELKVIAEKIDLPAEQVRYFVDYGTPRDKVLAKAKEINADLIVIGSRHPSISTHLLGSTASGIVAHAPISVLVVR